MRMGAVICITLILLGMATSTPINAQSGWSWQHPLPTGGDLWGIKLLNASTAVAVGDGGVILRTTDCGINWVKVSFGASFAFREIGRASCRERV